MSNPELEVLTPETCQLISIGRQPQMAFGVQSTNRQALAFRGVLVEALNSS